MLNLEGFEDEWWNVHQDTTWMDGASCAGIEDPDIFFPPRDKSLYKVIAAEAKSYCFGDDEKAPCPARVSCLFYSINFDEGAGVPHGIWGGLSHRERNALVRKWRKQYKGSMTLKQYIESLEKRAR